MTPSDRKDVPESKAADDSRKAADTAPEIAADDAGASAMAERKAKEMDQQAKS